MKKMFLPYFFAFASIIINSNISAQTSVYWRTNGPSDGSWEWGSSCDAAGDGQWYYNSWTGFRKRPDCYGFHDVYFDGNGINTMKLNGLTDFTVRSIYFTSNATVSRVLNTEAGRTLYLSAHSSVDPKIENNSSATHTFNVPIVLNNWAEINPVSGDLAFSGNINMNSNLISVYGSNSKVLTITGDISGTGGISLKQNSKIVLSTVSKSYTGATVIEAGNIELSVSLASSLITVKSGAKLTVTGTDVTINTLAIESGGIVEVQAGKALTVNGALTNSAGATGLIVKSGGSLIQNSDVSATVERTISGWVSATSGWHLISSPVSNQGFQPNFVSDPPSANEDFFLWDESQNSWINSKVGTTPGPYTFSPLFGTTFSVGKGYLAAYSATSTKQFIGTLNKNNIGVSNLVISAGLNSGWHLLGNPFTSALTWGTASWSLTHINGTAKIWNESSASYSDIALGTGIIPALNGFMVQVTDGFSGANSLLIPEVARVHSATSWYKSSSQASILLVANDPAGQTSQESIIRLDPEATSSFDPEFDSHFLPGFAPRLYSIAGDEKLSTNCLPSIPAESLIPFGFVKNDASSFSIELKESIDGYQVFLKDLKTNTDQNLTENPVYTFTSEANDDANRFLLHFLSTVGTSNPVLPTTSRIYISNRNIYIEGLYAKSEILVRNMLGQVVVSRNANGTGAQVINTANLTAGVYVVSVVTGKQVVSEKVVIK